MIKIDKKKFDLEGFLLVKKVFSKEEILSFREKCYNQFQIDEAKGLARPIANTTARCVNGDLLSKNLLSEILLDNRILEIVRTILGPKAVYFGDSNFQFGVGLRGYHRDNVDRSYGIGQDWEDNYPIIRFGLYLQDHKKYSGGLKVKMGTHESNTGKSIILDIEEGDLVFWNLKTLHSGNAVRLKFLSSLPVDYFERLVPNFLKVDESKERVACFFTFGLKGKHLDQYISKYMKVQHAVLTNIKNSPLSIEILEKAKLKSLEIVKPIPEYGS